MNFLSNVKMRNKLAILLIIPIAGLFFFSVSGIWEKSRVAGEMKRVHVLAELSIRISETVHELQKERGTTALYLGSSGTKYAAEHKAQWPETDKKVTALKEFLKGFNTEPYGKELKASIDNTMSSLDALLSKRNSGMTADKATEEYSAVNHELLDIIMTLATLSTNSELSAKIFAYMNMLETKERAGIERAILGNVFAKGQFGHGKFNSLTALTTITAEKDIYKDLFFFFAPSEQDDFYKRKMTGQFIDETARMRKIAVDKADKGKFGVDPGHWFKMQTGKIDLLKEVEDKLSSDLFQRASQIKKDARWGVMLYIFLTIAAVALSVIFGYYISQNITRSVNMALDLASRLARGDTSIIIGADYKDETGQLLKAMDDMALASNAMAEASSAIASGNLTVEIAPRSEKDVLGNALKNMIINLRAQMQDMTEGVNVLASSALQILTTTTQLSAAAAEMATAVTETTTTLEEVKQTSHVSNQKAKHVSETAQTASQISHAGKKSTEEVIEAINRIMGQMETIAESVVKLSDQTQAIGEIIASVDGLAEQSNLLAVNAAIEAAKAGEYGKGFAVVAQEIKTLAEQSKQSTSRVRTILNDIQKATNTSVMVTEQGTKAVEAGVKRSMETGEAINKLSESILSAAQAATQIAASSSQQLVGMDQVAIAMENIKQAIEQNAIGAKQLELASQNLKNLGQKLKDMIERYKI